MDELPPLYFEVEPSTSQQKSQMTAAQLRQVVAQVVIERLQHWCIQLFWMTVLCVMNCCGETDPKKHPLRQMPTQSLAYAAGGNRKRNSVAEIEKKLLRHLTSPYLTCQLRPVVRSNNKKRLLSRPPSPQLFDIQEEED